MSGLVYQAINAVAAELADNGVAKNHHNKEGDYQYRSIDDVLSALSPLLARHKLCVLPRALEREAVRSSRTSQLVTVRAAFDLVSAIDGSLHTVESFGEALDESDKGTSKAMSSAYKATMLQVFCIPVPQDDPDAASPRLNGRTSNGAVPEPPEGWESWSAEVIDIAMCCESAEAIDRLTSSRRKMLGSLQHSHPRLYVRVGEAIAAKLAGLQRPATKPEATAAEAPSKGVRRKKRKATADAACESAQAA